MRVRLITVDGRQSLLHGADSPPIKAPDILQTASKVSQSPFWMPIRGPTPTPIDTQEAQIGVSGALA
jgi:hypothetical protein